MSEENYISKWGYAIQKKNLTIENIIDLKKTLVAKPIIPQNSSFKLKDANFSVFKETPTKIYIPKIFGIQKYGIPNKCFKSYFGNNWDSPLQFNGTLYPRQVDPAEALLTSCVTNGGGILNIATGFGKTTIALNVLSQLKTVTLVIVNKISLLNQWKEEIKRFLPDARIGVIQGQKYDTKDKDIVIGMLQSLTQIDYPDDIFKVFGCVIVDECHNTSTRMFSQIFFKVCCKYTIGLSATPERSDGCEYVFKWHLGNLVDTQDLLNVERIGNIPTIRFVKLVSEDYKLIKKEIFNKETIQFTSMISDLVQMEKRNQIIITIIKQLVQENRKILVMSDRRNHLTNIHDLLLQENVSFTYGLFMGSMKTRDLEHAKTCTVILATFSAFSEGVSVYDLDTLLLITPKKYIDNDSSPAGSKRDNGKMKQIIGRIFRKDHIDTFPLIIDVCDQFSIYKSQSDTRRKFYKKNIPKYNIENISINLDKDTLDDPYTVVKKK
jgi:superfamily II DNA or RNA helicase